MVTTIQEMLIESGAIEFGDFLLASGVRSRYYIDIKTATTNPEILGAIGEEIAKTQDFDVVAGVAVGAVPIAVAVSLASKKPFAIIRKTEKEHGKSGSIIGEVKDRRVLLVEDVTTSGGSALYGVEVLRSAGADVEAVVTVVDREAGAAEAFRRQGVRFDALVRVSEVLNE